MNYVNKLNADILTLINADFFINPCKSALLASVSSAFKFLLIISLFACQKEENPIANTPVKKFYKTSEFVMGADLSYANVVEEMGGVFKSNNSPKDVFTIFKENGTNLVRVRLWHSPENWQKTLQNTRIYNNLADVEKTISRAKTAGMEVLLDLHYSDAWADPSKQNLPKAWENLNLTQLQDSVYHYTSSILNYLDSKKLTPEFIQIGNENNSGMLFPHGRINNSDFKNFAVLLKSGIKAVRDFSSKSSIKPKIILHVAQFQNVDWWLNGLVFTQNLIDFDIIGVSHYFNYSNLKTMTEIESQTAQIIQKFKKPLMVVETAFPFTNQNADSYGNIINVNSFGNYQISKDEQLRYMKDLTNALYRGGASGIIYWEPAWVSSKLKDGWGVGSSWENNAFFDFQGNSLPVFEYMTTTYPF